MENDKKINEQKEIFLKRFREYGCKELTEIKCCAKKSFEEEKTD
ncbi:MAG: hypothetical protein PWQ67_797 [Clostridia bacterium]|nr:hypothetical protein [Clostridia bacterium]MDN5322343.1 hypothetical protein [Clostridia bacterium]